MSPLTLFPAVISTYLLSEIVFYLIYRIYIKPRANVRGPTPPYRDYGNDRHKLALRILSRLTRLCRYTKRPLLPTIESYLRGFYYRDDDGANTSLFSPRQRRRRRWNEVPPLTTAASSPSSNDNDDDETMYLSELKRNDVEDLFSWAFFNKPSPAALTPAERTELERIGDILQRNHNWDAHPGRSSEGLRVMSLSLDDVTSLHRPLLVYVCFNLLQRAGRFVLRRVGFRYVRHAVTGVGYWYRDVPSSSSSSQLSPLVFFHGIAPCGITFAIRLLLSMCRGGNNSLRPVLIVENPAVTHSLGFISVTEEDIVLTVTDALERHFPLSLKKKQGRIVLMGHSFGSVLCTWVVRAMPERVGQLVLLDPVSLLLSEPDVICNFVYERKFWESLSSFLMHFVASTEVFVEWYLRRQFFFYNGELWLDGSDEASGSVPDHVKVTVCLAENDAIVNAERVKDYIHMCNEEREKEGKQNVELVYWKDMGHAECLVRPESWENIRKIVNTHEETQWKNQASVSKKIVKSSISKISL